MKDKYIMINRKIDWYIDIMREEERERERGERER